MIHDILSENVRKEIDSIRTKFPHDKNKSSIIESLLVIQHENSGYLNEELIEALAQYLNVQKIDVYEVATFYSMFNLKPIGKNTISVLSLIHISEPTRLLSIGFCGVCV